MTGIELPTTAGRLESLFGGTLVGNPDAEISHLASLDSASPGALCFFSDRKYADRLEKANGAVVFTREELARSDLPVTFLVVKDPQASFAEVARTLRSRFPWKGVSPLALVSPSAVLHPTARVAPYVHIGERARIGAGSCLYPFTYIGADANIGEDCELHPRVTVFDRVQIGNRVKIHTGAVLGSDGFGFFRPEGQVRYQDMPQIGTVVIEDDVRIGAYCAIDRATLKETRIRRGTKLDNLVHVGHNSLIEENCIVCAQVGLGGSVHLNEDVILGGQVGLGQGVEVGKGARMGGQSGSGTNVPGDETYFFTPATPVREFGRIWRMIRKLPELGSRIKKLEAGAGEESGA